jgi:hypothetical protein
MDEEKTTKTNKSKRPTPAERRAERLKAELKANLVRRKAQARARREGAEDDRPGKLISGNDSE